MVELLATLAIATILMGLAAPSFRDMVAKRRQGAESSILMEHLLLARNEARNSTAPVSVCLVGNTGACDGTSWQGGHLVFRDGGTAGAIDGADVTLARADAATVSISAVVQATGTAMTDNYISFDGEGKLLGDKAIMFIVCAAGEKPRNVLVRLNGNITASVGETACT